MALRVKRVRLAIRKAESAISGMTKCCQVPLPELGSQPSQKLSVRISTMASTKLGIA